MERVLAILKSFPPEQPDSPEELNDEQYDEYIQSYCTALIKFGKADIATIVSNAGTFLQSLDPRTHTVGYAYVLDLLLQDSSLQHNVDRNVLLDKAFAFITNFDARQMRYAGHYYRRLTDLISSGKVFSQPSHAIQALASAILQLNPRGSVLTSTHLSLVKIAYDASTFDAAFPVIDKDILFYPYTSQPRPTKLLCDLDLEPSAYISPANGLTQPMKHASVLDYYTRCGSIYMAARKWAEARVAFERVFSYPTKDRGMEPIVPESYKKWILLGLLSSGQAPAMPTSVPSMNKNSLSNIGAPYLSVANLFVTTNAKELMAEIETNAKKWEDDGNTRLINEILEAYQKWQIINLRNVYQRISISEIRTSTLDARTANNLGPNEEVLRLIRQMIETQMFNGELEAVGEETYLRFKDDFEVMTEGDFAVKIAEKYAAVQQLSKQYKSANEVLGTNKEFLRQVIRDQKRSDREKADAAAESDAQIEEEDLMTGIVKDS